MIEYLSGKLIEKTPTKAVLLCGGVGYGLFITLKTYEQLPDVEAEASLFTYLSVREDAMILFGFSEAAERDMFLLLTSVSGIGPKTAIGVLSGMGAEQLRDNIAAANSAALTTLPGIGKKSAERLVLELRDKIDSVPSGTLPMHSDGGAKAIVRGDALSALVELGYGRPAAERAIRAALKSGPEVEASVESLIKAALRELQR
ncbi:MAG: Holliday junction branch migration protein RuvA [Candidatus Kapaibacterium sp.]